MPSSAPAWALIVVALMAANLPFVTQRLFGLLPLRSGKTALLRMLELLALYAAVGGAGFWLEWRSGQVAPQGWAFYAVTGTLFLTLAFPGFVWRYLIRHPRTAPSA